MSDMANGVYATVIFYNNPEEADAKMDAPEEQKD